MKKKLSIFVLIALIASCSSLIVKKQHAQSIKKVAVISVFSNLGLNNQDHNSRTNPQAVLKPNRFFSMNKLLNYSYNKFMIGLNDATGWRVVPYNRVARSRAYRNFRKKLTQNYAVKGYGWSKYLFNNTMSYKNCPKVLFNGKDKDMKQMIGKLCRDLRVDAVAIGSFDYGYGAKMSIGIAASGKVYTYAHLQVIDKLGNVVIATPLAGPTGFEGQSSDSFAMVSIPFVGYKFPINNKSWVRLTSAVDNSIVTMRTKLKKLLQ